MKKKDVYEVTIIVIGIIAAWKFIEFLIASLTVYLSVHSLATNIKSDFWEYHKHISAFSIFFLLCCMVYSVICSCFILTKY